MTNGHVQHITMEESTSIEWVKVNWYFFYGKPLCNFLICFPSQWGPTFKNGVEPISKGEAKRNSQKVFPFGKVAGKYRGISCHRKYFIKLAINHYLSHANFNLLMPSVP